MKNDAAELLVVGVPGTGLDDATEELLQRVGPGGVILFPRNIESEDQLRGLIGEIRRLVPDVLLYLDAEGGRVDRLRPLVGPSPSGRALSGQRPAVVQRAGRWIGRALAGLGFDVDLAPVVDLDYGHRNNALDERYLGADPKEVIRRAQGFLLGLHESGVAGCLKHFPGLGAAGEDTHHEGTVIDRTRDELRRDLLPFQRLGYFAGAILIGHAIYPDLDPQRRPASLSPAVATGLLRWELGFPGVLMSDDLDMHALEPWGDMSDRAEAALMAGCDVLFLCNSLESAPTVLERLSEPGLQPRCQEARERVGAFRSHCQSLSGPARTTSLETVRQRLADLNEALSEAAG